MSKLKILSANDIEDAYTLETGSIGLNRALNGGLMGGRFHIYWGPKASGKTTQALFSIAEAQRLGKTCLYVDAEKTFSKIWAAKCGVDVHDLRYIRSNKVEDILETILPLIEKGEIDVVVVDSLSSIFLSSHIESPDSKGIGIGARSMNFLTSKLLAALQWETQVIMIAHGNMASNAMGMSLQAKTSKSVEHWASTIVKFRLGGSQSNDFRDDGARQVYWTVEKSKHSPYPVSGAYWLSAQSPAVFIDQATEVANLCKEAGVVQGATWLSYGDQKWQGTKNFAADLKSDRDLFNFFLDKLNSIEVLPEEVEAEEDEEE